MTTRPVPALPCGDAPYDAPFHAAVTHFVQAHGVPVPLPPREGRVWSAWRVTLAWPPGTPALLPPPGLWVVREGLDEDDVAVCDQCRIMGEGGRGRGGRGMGVCHEQR